MWPSRAGEAGGVRVQRAESHDRQGRHPFRNAAETAVLSFNNMVSGADSAHCWCQATKMKRPSHDEVEPTVFVLLAARCSLSRGADPRAAPLSQMETMLGPTEKALMK
eukprot:2253211-Rhodomonas_salina.1